MENVEVGYMDYLKETFTTMDRSGLLLVSTSQQGKSNVMTIGWGTIGIIWAKPIFIVLVRPSRFTYGLIEETGDFTVNVPPMEMSEKVSFCGTVSGREHDKFIEQKITAIPAKEVRSPLIEECLIHYECKVVHKNDVLPPELAADIPPAFYPQGDYHRVFYGEIVRVCVTRDIKKHE